MMIVSSNFHSNEEHSEAKRFDKRAKYELRNDFKLLIKEIHWKKFDTDKQVLHPYAFVVQSLDSLAGKKVLEIGCGTGAFSVILAKRGAKFVDAFDISPESIAVAKKRAVINNVDKNVNYKAISVYEMDYRENYFDYIVGMNVLHHIEIEKVVDRFYKYLKPGGIAIFNDPFGNVKWLEKLRLFVPVKINEEDKTHWEEQLTYKDVEKFKILFNNIEFKEFHLFSRLDRILKSRFIIESLAKFDDFLLRNFSFLRKYSRRLVISLKK